MFTIDGTGDFAIHAIGVTGFPADVNGDSLDDLVSISTYFTIYENQGNYQFASGQIYPSSFPPMNYGFSAIADSDGDGRDDFLVPVITLIMIGIITARIILSKFNSCSDIGG